MSTEQKLGPPQIDTSLAPIIAVVDEEYKVISCSLTVPLYSNPAVALGDIKGISLQFKTVSTGVIKETKEYYISDNSNIKFGDSISLDLAPIYNVGQYYKIQYAFLSDGGIDEEGKQKYTTGYWSTVGISKCTVQPTIAISNLVQYTNDQGHSENTIYYGGYSYVGEYNSPDSTEKVYSYCFTIMKDNTVFDTSGVLLHNVNNDTDKNSSIDIWTSSKMLSQRQKYTITYEVTTINGITIKTQPYIIQSGQHGFIPTEGSFIATLYEEDGYVDLHFKNINNEFLMLNAGNYVITRASSKNNFEHWIKICDFILPQNTENVHFFNDYTVEQGISYRYGLQLIQPDKQLTARQEALYYLNKYNEASNNQVPKLKVDFEDAFLSDGQRQLRIRYNPKVASFKSTILESKVDTLGGKHPFIFRNGNINYKEFSISGLISMLMDSNAHFMPAPADDEMTRFTTPGYLQSSNTLITNLVGDNFVRERDFKMEVLSWLTNGKPKLFRSPSEGNYIIRTMNVSLIPNDTLGRMLHTFNCTAYEIAEFDMMNLLQYNLMQSYIEIEKKNIMVFDEVLLTNLENSTIQFPGSGARYLCFDGAYNDHFVSLQFANGDTQLFNVGNSTGKYVFTQLADNPVIKIITNPTSQIKLTYGHYREDQNVSQGEIYNISTKVVVQQFIGNNEIENQNLVTSIIDEHTSINYCYLVKVNPKPIVNIAKYDEQWVYASQLADGIAYSKEAVQLDLTVLYYDIEKNQYYIYNGTTLEELKDNVPDYRFYLNNDKYSFMQPTPIGIEFINATRLLSNELDNLYDNTNTLLLAAQDVNQPVQIKKLVTGGRFESITNIGQLKNLQIGNGLVCDIVYELYTYQTKEA